MARAAKECCPHNRWDLLRLRDWEAISILVVRGKRGKKQVQKQQVQDVGEVEVTEQWDYGDRCGGGWGSGVLLCACLWPLLWGLGSGRWTQKAPALMTVWSAARGAGPLSKRGHSFCLRSLAGPIQPPPHTHLANTRSLPTSLFQRREGEGVFCHQRLNVLAEVHVTDKVYRQGVPTGFKKTDLLSDLIQKDEKQQKKKRMSSFKTRVGTAQKWLIKI